MKKRVVKISIILFSIITIFSSLFGCGDAPGLQELGMPGTDRTAKQRVAWDIILYNNKIYIGGGDYNNNLGPTTIYAYDISSNKFIDTGTLEEEEINRFYIFDNQLVAPGIDQSSGSYSQWHTKNLDENWITKRSFYNAHHNFDIIKYNGTWFAGVGAGTTAGPENGYSPIQYRAEGENSFHDATLIKDGVPVNTVGGEQIRTYDFFVLKGELYATYVFNNDSTNIYELYKYQDGVFVYDNTWASKVKRIATNYIKISGKAEFKDKMYIATGYLYETPDMNQMNQISFSENQCVVDVLVQDDILYTLSYIDNQDDTYTIYVHKNQTGDSNDFEEIFNFNYSVPPQSFLKNGNHFYFGMGKVNSDNAKNGVLLRYNYVSEGK